jgi:hypothetical protein
MNSTIVVSIRYQFVADLQVGESLVDRRRLEEISLNDGEQPQSVPVRDAAFGEPGVHVPCHADLDQALVFVQQEVDHRPSSLAPADFPIGVGLRPGDDGRHGGRRGSGRAGAARPSRPATRR